MRASSAEEIVGRGPVKFAGWPTYVMGMLNGIGLTCVLVVLLERCA